MHTLTELWKEIKNQVINLIPGILSLLGFNSSIIFLASGLTNIINHSLEYIYGKIFSFNLESKYPASIEIHKYNERKSLNQVFRVVNWYIIKGINDSTIQVHRLICNESSILDDDYIIRDEAIFHADYTIVPDEDYYVDINWNNVVFRANHYIIGVKRDNPVYKIYGQSIDLLKEFEEYCLVQHREYSKSIGKDIYKYFEYLLEDEAWDKHDIETTKTLENIFIPHTMKEDLKSKIDVFNLSREHYIRWGIPYKMGFVFHGHPGCGKTSTIYSIANYLGRSIYFLKLDLFGSNHELLRAAHQIPRDAIVVIEDIDAHKVAHNRQPEQKLLPRPIIIRRTDNKNINQESSEFEGKRGHIDKEALNSLKSLENLESLESLERLERLERLESQKDGMNQKDQNNIDDGQEDALTEYSDTYKSDKRENKNCMEVDDDNHDDNSNDDMDGEKFIMKASDIRPYKKNDSKGKTIDSLLEILDGYNYLPGAIVIITTNHLNMIDPALVRAGRMDHHYFFDYAAPETINDILNFFYVTASIDGYLKDIYKSLPKPSDQDSSERTNLSDLSDLSNHSDFPNLPDLSDRSDLPKSSNFGNVDIVKQVSIDFSRYNSINPVTTAEIINSIILPNVRDQDRAIKILKEKLFC